MLVPSYTEVASGYRDLGLKTLTIENLFIPEKLPSTLATVVAHTRRATIPSEPGEPEPAVGKTAFRENAPQNAPFPAVATANADVWNTVGRTYTIGPNRDRAGSLGDDDDGASVASSPSIGSPTIRKGKKRINPDLVSLPSPCPMSLTQMLLFAAFIKT